ncbi:MAG TPA: NYN domain-containing protein [Candidatus Dojkabacteria bacterium]|nr:NYN domain-containing protein [Candidatus Dojkabacteria bacterium]
MENNYAFINSQNLNLGVRSEGWELDFKKFRLYLRNKYAIKKAFLFIGYIKQNQNLYRKLKGFGYEIIFKPTLSHFENNVKVTKGNVDAELVLHTMIEYNHFHKAIIVTGDGDFYCLVKYLADKNKLYKILVPTKQFSALYRNFMRRKYIIHVSNLKSFIKR